MLLILSDFDTTCFHALTFHKDAFPQALFADGTDAANTVKS
jgi:hypothetical protein